MRLLRHFLDPDSVYLEVGAGDCHLAATIARQVRQAYAVEASDVIAGSGPRPANFQMIISEGIGIGVQPGVATVAYSHMLLEHLHPDDADQHVHEVYQALAPGGVYICVTQHSVSGPHDISKDFDEVATGFHLKEYTYRELRNLFRRVGFASTKPWMGLKGRFFPVPETAVSVMERLLHLLPRRLAKGMALRFPLKSLYSDVTIVGHKPSN
jgi:hypothetical protein